jgi:TM2 domain-containing membrane protein YozV
MNQCSEKSYVVAVCLSSIFGLIGIQHFYLGRYREGIADLALTVGWIYCFIIGDILYALLFLAADLLHAFIATILLIIGSYKDGLGKYVCYPGQKL